MKIQHTNNINFGTKVNTMHVIELTTLKMFEPRGFTGMTDTMKKLYDVPKATGRKGYKYYAKLVGDKILEKYPEIKDITNTVNNLIKQNPDMSPKELHNKVCSLISKIGEEIDIVI